ncbi:NACHT domain-containing protein [Streptomyces sp. NPDC004134]|uniref:NACHT domain-containing protein n=1 Tax=Streptomyces sp. NPDC004134 TaxID=3364691 RepID=UPI003684ED7A
MTYYYEQLDPERFQHFAQALISREFPGTQCFPVGQRDGGRDAVQYLNTQSDSYRLFQVKFVRNPFSVEDAHKWLVDTMQEELKKLTPLLEANPNVLEYILVTNVAGTAYPGSGSIDTLNTALKTKLPVPIRAWWRDDLDRRCDTAADIKWAYPDILRGVDVLQALADSIGSDLEGHRLDVLRSFIADQYDMDNEVRFKQVELSNDILSLFVDVPVEVRVEPEAGRRRDDRRAMEIYHIAQQLAGRDPWDIHQDSGVGAATLLLNERVAQLGDAVVLEGGPGQGKSTLAQYICQVHRMKILSSDDFEVLPKSHRPSAARFPIKVDLREYATWLAGRDPFSQEGKEPRPRHMSKSLESFISALISERSGGRTFTPDDLSAVAHSSALLIVLDGLDEVAEVKIRNDVVREITAAARRLRETAASLQMLVTTRPSALAEVSDFPTRRFNRWMLTSLNRPLIEEYTERWARSRRLSGKEVADLRRVLSDRLGQAHMRDLARNPMQLAILLSVIHTRGSSLPDKRTALYDIYVELFLAREAEKSEVVKKRQEILIDIHRYLAWTLHSEAETGRALGKMDTHRLRELIGEYLLTEGRDPGLAGELFTGLAQRVVFLVGAVEGLFEFEVQPLREYFAGRFLYETAPYSPVGSPRSGTKDERFDAIARNTYWQNVTRFYAGCFSKGELPSLVDRLEVLCTDVDLGLTSHPRALAATLVADWVFSQNARSLKKVINLILDRDGYRSLLGDERVGAAGRESFTLPEGCGRVELLERCFEVLKTAPPRDIQTSLTQLAQQNGSKDELREHWLNGFPALTEYSQKVSWVWTGYYTGVLSAISTNAIEKVLIQHSVTINDEIQSALMAATHADYFTRSRRLTGEFADRILDGFVTGARVPRAVNNRMDIFCVALNPSSISRAYRNPRSSLSENISRHLGVRWPEELPPPTGNPAIDLVVEDFIGALSSTGEDALTARYETYIEGIASAVGVRWAVWVMALGYATSTSRAKRESVGRPDLFDDSVGIVKRLQYARLQAGAATWWKRQLLLCDDETSRQLWALTSLLLCGPATVAKLCPEIEDVIEGTDDRQSRRLFEAVDSTRSWSGTARAVRVSALPSSLSPRVAAIFANVAERDDHIAIVDKYLSNYLGSDPVVHDVIVFAVAFKLQHTDEHVDWANAVEVTRRAYRTSDADFRLGPRRSQNQMPVDIAKKVAANSSAYPRFMVRLAEASMRRAIARKTVPLSQVAEDNGWFEEE